MIAVIQLHKYRKLKRAYSAEEEERRTEAARAESEDGPRSERQRT